MSWSVRINSRTDLLSATDSAMTSLLHMSRLALQASACMLIKMWCDVIQTVHALACAQHAAQQQ